MRRLHALLALALLPGCDSLQLSSSSPRVQVTAPEPLADDAAARSANVSGYAWDPESFFFALASGQGALPPVTVAGVPTLERALVSGAAVSLVDPLSGAQVARVPSTSSGGTWELLGVPAQDVPMQVVTEPADGTPSLRMIGPPQIAMIPDAQYVPTASLQPLVTRSHLCAAVKAPLISESGILEAVTNALTAAGTNTTVADLLDPARFGGVAVVWLYATGGPNVRAPAANTTVEASIGTVLSIAWAPPTLGPPGQSARGFFVVDAPVSPIGVRVVLLPPGTTDAVQLTAVDPSSAARTFPALPLVHLTPGLVSFAELPAITPGAVPAPEWACLP